MSHSAGIMDLQTTVPIYDVTHDARRFFSTNDDICGAFVMDPRAEQWLIVQGPCVGHWPILGYACPKRHFTHPRPSPVVIDGMSPPFSSGPPAPTCDWVINVTELRDHCPPGCHLGDLPVLSRLGYGIRVFASYCGTFWPAGRPQEARHFARANISVAPTHYYSTSWGTEGHQRREVGENWPAIYCPSLHQSISTGYSLWLDRAMQIRQQLMTTIESGTTIQTPAGTFGFTNPSPAVLADFYTAGSGKRALRVCLGGFTEDGVNVDPTVRDEIVPFCCHLLKLQHRLLDQKAIWGPNHLATSTQDTITTLAPDACASLMTDFDVKFMRVWEYLLKETLHLPEEFVDTAINYFTNYSSFRGSVDMSPLIINGQPANYDLLSWEPWVPQYTVRLVAPIAAATA